jgi:dihydroorotate dehydrogenase
MGFNNGGVLEAVERLKANNGVLVGILVKKLTTNEEATLITKYA